MAKKQDPFWIDLFADIAKAKWGVRTEKTNIHLGRLKQAKEFHDGICAGAEQVLKRPPVLSDISQDFIEMLARKYLREYASNHITRYVSNRIDRLKLLCELAHQRFNVPSIDWDAVPLSKRVVVRDIAAKSVPVPEVRPDDLPPGTDVKAAESKLTAILDQYRRERLLGKSKHTYRLMKGAVDKFELFLCRAAKLSDLNQDTVLEFIHALLNNTELSDASIRTMQERLLALWRYANAKHWLIYPPMMAIVGVPQRIPDSWTPDEMKRLLDAAKAMPGLMVGCPSVPWKLFWPTLIYVVYDSGERIGAVLQLKHDDVANGWLTVRAEYRKGRTRDKKFKLRQCTLESIAQLRAAQGPSANVIFAFPYCETYLYKLFNELLTSAVHKIRRTCASLFENAGGDAGRLLDHRHRSTTEKYLDPTVVKERQFADLCPGIGESPADSQNDASLLQQLRDMLSKK